jgi:factor associated with neutral sphingomyelinase activation
MRDCGVELFFTAHERAAAISPADSGKRRSLAGSSGPGSGSSSGLSGSSSSIGAVNSVYFAFDDSKIRDSVMATIRAQPSFRPVREASLKWLTYRWSRGLISNFDYLMAVNQAAGRSFNDITQYPVFPWVIADYTSAALDLTKPATFRDLSKPIGALNPKRLADFKRRMKDMPMEMCNNRPFLYGTHYSTPGMLLHGTGCSIGHPL